MERYLQRHRGNINTACRDALSQDERLCVIPRNDSLREASMGSWTGRCLLLRGGWGKDKTPLLTACIYCGPGLASLWAGERDGLKAPRSVASPELSVGGTKDTRLPCVGLRSVFNGGTFHRPLQNCPSGGGAKETRWTRAGSKYLGLRHLGGSRWGVWVAFLCSLPPECLSEGAKCEHAGGSVARFGMMRRRRARYAKWTRVVESHTC